MKEKIKIISPIFIIILIILGLAFYWYEWRPTQIRKNCFNTSLDFSKDYQNEFYINCVRGNGVNP